MNGYVARYVSTGGAARWGLEPFRGGGRRVGGNGRFSIRTFWIVSKHTPTLFRKSSAGERPGNDNNHCTIRYKDFLIVSKHTPPLRGTPFRKGRPPHHNYLCNNWLHIE